MSHAPEESKRCRQRHFEPGLMLGNIELQCINESCSHHLIVSEPKVPRSTGGSQRGNGLIFVSHISASSGFRVRPQGFLERHDNRRKLGDAIKRNVWVLALAVLLVEATGPADSDVIGGNKLSNSFHLGGMTLGFAHIMEAMGDRSRTANISLRRITNVAAELIQTEGKVLTLARGRSGTRGTAAATASN